MPKYRPIAHATETGNVAVYVGAAYQELPTEAARLLHAQLGPAIDEAEKAASTAPELFEVQMKQWRERLRSAPPTSDLGEARLRELEKRAMREIEGERHG